LLYNIQDHHNSSFFTSGWVNPALLACLVIIYVAQLMNIKFSCNLARETSKKTAAASINGETWEELEQFQSQEPVADVAPQPVLSQPGYYPVYYVAQPQYIPNLYSTVPFNGSK